MWYHVPSRTMWAWVSNYTDSHSSEHGTLPTKPLISKQAVPYWTHGDSCCPGVSTPKIWSLATLSMTIHITWRNPAVSTIPTYAQTIATILTMVTSHHNGWKTNTLNTNTSQTQHHKDGKTCTTLMTAWLSITNQVWKKILNYEALVIVLMHAGQCVY
jgi:hypothetical protein